MTGVRYRLNTACAVCDMERATMLHHIVRRAHGRDDSPDNLLPVCPACHQRIHNDVAWAYEHGYLRRSTT